jgi:DNA-binding MarR family transcriptional regulator
MLTRLQKNGLVEIKYDKNNSKISKVYLTEEGNKKNRYAKEILDNLKDIYYIDFSDREKETFEKLLNKISNNIENKMKEEKNENA